MPHDLNDRFGSLSEDLPLLSEAALLSFAETLWLPDDADSLRERTKFASDARSLGEWDFSRLLSGSPLREFPDIFASFLALEDSLAARIEGMTDPLAYARANAARDVHKAAALFSAWLDDRFRTYLQDAGEALYQAECDNDLPFLEQAIDQWIPWSPVESYKRSVSRVLEIKSPQGD